MKKTLVLFVFFFFFVLLGPLKAFDPEWGHGPLPTRNYSPVALHFLSMVGAPAKTLPKNRWQISTELIETNTLLSEDSSRVNADLKLETLRVSFNLAYGLTENIQVGVEVPLLYRFNGFMNAFIESVEEAFSRLSPDRLRLRDSEFLYQIDLDGQRVIGGVKEDIGLGDVVMETRWLILDELERRPAVALRMALKIPTGNTLKAFGSGDPDIGLGFAVQKGLGERWVLYFNVNGIFPTSDFRDTGLGLDPFFNGMLAFEFRLTPRFSILTQFEYYTMPFRGLNSPIFEDEVAEITLGMSYLYQERFLFQIGGIENFSNPFPHESAADFSAFIAFGFQM